MQLTYSIRTFVTASTLSCTYAPLVYLDSWSSLKMQFWTCYGVNNRGEFRWEIRLGSRCTQRYWYVIFSSLLCKGTRSTKHSHRPTPEISASWGSYILALSSGVRPVKCSPWMLHDVGAVILVHYLLSIRIWIS